MEEKARFSNSLLEGTIETKVNYFKEYTVAHPFFMVAYNSILERIASPGNRSVSLVYGPSGVGKSALIKKIKEKFEADFAETIQKNKGIIPIANMEAPAPTKGKYDWKDHFVRVLDSLKEPMIDYKVDYSKILSKGRTSDHGKEGTIQRSAENALIYRNTQVYLIDEAQHLSLTSSAKVLKDQMEIIKSVASLSKTPHVLFGTYDLLNFRNLSGQLSRRGKDIHFRRYDAHNENERKMFIQTLWNLQKHMPLEEEPNLVSEWKFFYEKSIGCIGTLKDFLQVTLEINLKRNEGIKSLSIEDFKEFALDTEQVYRLVKEATEGEVNVKNSEKDRNELQALLGLENSHESIINEHEQSDDTKQKENTQKGKKRKGAVGERNPYRDKVGGE